MFFPPFLHAFHVILSRGMHVEITLFLISDLRSEKDASYSLLAYMYVEPTKKKSHMCDVIDTCHPNKMYPIHFLHICILSQNTYVY